MSVTSQSVLEHQPNRVLGYCQGFSLVLPICHNLGKRRHPHGKAPLFLWFENHCEFSSLHRNAPWSVLTKLYLCWYVVRKGSTASWVGDHSQTTLWQIDKMSWT